MKENPGSGSRKNRGLKTKPRAAPLPMHDITCAYYYYFIFASQHDPLASPSRALGQTHRTVRGAVAWHGLPVARERNANGGYGRSSRTRTYTYMRQHIHARHTYMTSATGTPAR